MSLKAPMTFTADTFRERSSNLWGDIIAKYNRGDIGGVYHREDFTYGGLLTQSSNSEVNMVGMPYYGFGSTDATHTFADTTGGELVVTEATDNEAVYARAQKWPFQVSSLLGDLYFETRIKVSAITDNQIGFMCGLWTNVVCSGTVPLTNANPPVMATTGDFIGFWGPEEDAGGVDAIYKAGGVTEVVVNATCHQFVADTHVKLGFKFSRNYNNTNIAKIEYYVNGVSQGSPKTVPDNTGTDFPADVRLGFMFGQRLGAATSSLTTCDWYECFQEDTTVR